jgi:hypothetical protein
MVTHIFLLLSFEQVMFNVEQFFAFRSWQGQIYIQ